jgi:flagellum-specific ATP synthase
MAGMTLEAEGCEAPVGSRCVVVDADGSTAETEVGFSEASCCWSRRTRSEA